MYKEKGRIQFDLMMHCTGGKYDENMLNTCYQYLEMYVWDRHFTEIPQYDETTLHRDAIFGIKIGEIQVETSLLPPHVLPLVNPTVLPKVTEETIQQFNKIANEHSMEGTPQCYIIASAKQ